MSLLLCWTLLLYFVYDIVITSLFVVRISQITMAEQMKEFIPIIVFAFVDLILSAYSGSMLRTSHFVQLIAGEEDRSPWLFVVAKFTRLREFEYLMRLLPTRKYNGEKAH